MPCRVKWPFGQSCNIRRAQAPRYRGGLEASGGNAGLFEEERGSVSSPLTTRGSPKRSADFERSVAARLMSTECERKALGVVRPIDCRIWRNRPAEYPSVAHHRAEVRGRVMDITGATVCILGDEGGRLA